MANEGDGLYTGDGSVDIKGNPVLKRNTGNWRACPFILGTECCERLAYYGIATNLVTYLTHKLHEGNVSAARNVTTWSGTCYLTPLIGAVLADAYWGRYWTIAVFSTIYFIVLVASFRKWNLDVPKDSSLLYETQDKVSAIRGSRKLEHSDELTCLDKAAVISETETKTGDFSNPWRVCTVTQVEELKILIRMFPIWATGIVFSAVYAQMSTMFVEQGMMMDTSIGAFTIPPASLSTFDVISVIFWVPVYDRFIVPIARRFTGKERGFSELQRMGIGLFLSVLCMSAAAVVEINRLNLAKELDLVDKEVAVPMSILWQIPQYFLLGAAEIFTFIGQLEFFYDQSPDAMRSLCSALSLLTNSLGNYLSSLILTLVTYFTTKDGNSGWITDNLNGGHLDYFFWLLAGLSLLNMLVYVVCAKSLECEYLKMEVQFALDGDGNEGGDLYTGDGSVDSKGNPALKNNTGQWKACSFILGTFFCERLAFYGISTNLVNYFIDKLHEETVVASTSITNWKGTCYITPLIGAILADTYWGRYWTIAGFTSVYLIGMCTLTLSASVPALKPAECVGSVCPAATTAQYAVLIAGLYLIALGTGGIKPCIWPFGADQFDDTDPKERVKKGSYFNWFYFSQNIGAIIASSLLVWIQENVGWGIGFGIPTALMGVCIASLLIGTPLYRFQKPGGSPLTRMFQVLVAAFRKRTVKVLGDSDLYETQDKSSAIEGSRKLEHSNELRCLDKAALITDTEIAYGNFSDPWRLCTVTQLARELGLIHQKVAVPLSILWQIPQYFLLGAAEVFTFIGQHEFYYEQAPDAMRSLCSALSLLTNSLGNYLSSLILTIVTSITTEGGKAGWIPDNLNEGHLDYFYWLLAGLSFLNLVVYMVFSRKYIEKKASAAA
ncbi:hypothetical protein C1H46_042510 [Malus baccata]|uniref:Uncharacterized protein n=1 Tax=Malus baccata TaxID=106549 RepID=A0A540KCI2_MALBA|nr:hypothetical protein C1H46_042510 [Malus baccata]